MNIYEDKLQNSKYIREHLDELHAAENITENKELLYETIEYWEWKFKIKVEREQEEVDNKYKQKKLSYERKRNEISR
tara:strand:- start:184 stop:414 length:231 start_codon:yes stop_codon:yes gene_type:complete